MRQQNNPRPESPPQYITPLGIIHHDDTEEAVKKILGEPSHEVSSANTKSLTYYSENLQITAVLLQGKIKGVLQEKIRKSLRDYQT